MIHINQYPESKEAILRGVSKIAEPVIQTLTPKGSNCMLPNGQYTNDGKTIAGYITSEDPLEELIIQNIRQAANKTDMAVGDGTSTTILLAQQFVQEGIKLLDSDWNRMALQKELNDIAPTILKAIDNKTHKIESDKDLEFIANVSSGGDKEIAKNIVETIKVVGDKGQVSLDINSKPETELVKEDGFIIDAGMFSEVLSNVEGRLQSVYKDAKILITDKNIYHSKEALDILNVVNKEGFKDVVIVAKNFTGQSINTFLSNHAQGKMNILLVKDPDTTDTDISSLEDLAAYVGCNFISDKKGRLTNSLTIKDFGTVGKVISDLGRTIIYSKNKALSAMRVKAIEELIENESNEKKKKELEDRLARMTQGMVTIKVGARTPSELREKMYRYEDAINAARSANKEGYVVGGGVTLYEISKSLKIKNPDIRALINKVCVSPLRQISINCDLHLSTLLDKVDGNIGYNAVTEKYEDLHKAGIIEPSSLLKNAFSNALSVSLGILTSRFQLTLEEEEEPKKKETKDAN